MRHSMRASFCITFIALLAASGSAQVVETFSGTRTYFYAMPGAPDGGGGLDFNYSSFLSALVFTPGSVSFDGQPVDFSGTEAAWLASSHSGTANFPVTAGPATVDTTGTFVWSGPALNGAGARDQGNVDLGPGFSASSLDLAVSFPYDGRDHVLSWSSGVVPELNGQKVDIKMQETVFAVDPVNGIVDVSFSGQIVVIQDPIVPVTSPVGLWLLGLGVLGLGLMFLRRQS